MLAAVVVGKPLTVVVAVDLVKVDHLPEEAVKVDKSHPAAQVESGQEQHKPMAVLESPAVMPVSATRALTEL